MTRAASALAAPGISIAPPRLSRARKALLISWLSIMLLQSAIENAMARGLGRGNRAGRQRRDQAVQRLARQTGKALGSSQKALPFPIAQRATGQRLVLADIVGPGPGVRPIGVGIGNRAFAGYGSSIGQRHDNLATKSAFGRISVEIASRPFGIFHRADLVP